MLSGVCEKLSRIFKDYFKNCTLHGVRFLVDDSYHQYEKIFWGICIVISWIASAQLIMASIEQFQNNPISFVVETSYLDWDTHFPSIVVCENKNMDRIQEKSEALWGMDHDFTLEEVLIEMSFFRGELYHTLHECGGRAPLKDCIMTNFSYYAMYARSECKNILDLCYWNDQKFDCCEYFLPMETEIGVCYAINSKHSKNPLNKRLHMVSNKYTGPGSLKIDIYTDAYVYIIAEEDVPNLITPKADVILVNPYISYIRKISIRNIENAEGIRNIDVERRSCRYNDENILNVHEYYSYSACSVQCRKDAQLRICNCTSHLMPHTDESLHCNMTGLRCLNDNYEELSVLVAKWASGKKGIVCDCMPSCTELDISIVEDARELLNGTDTSIAKVEIGLSALPTERYKRNVVRARLDLVVSIGGTTGLFVGASFLSFIEIIYYLTIRPLSIDVR